MDFGEKLRTLRREKGLSQEELANMVGVSRQAMSKWESNQTQPELDKLILLSGIFDVTVDSMIKDDVPVKAAPAPVVQEIRPIYAAWSVQGPPTYTPPIYPSAIENASPVAQEGPDLKLKKRRLLVPLDSKGPIVAAILLMISLISSIINSVYYLGQGIPLRFLFSNTTFTMNFLVVSGQPFALIMLIVLLMIFAKRTPSMLAIPFGMLTAVSLINLIMHSLGFFNIPQQRPYYLFSMIFDVFSLLIPFILLTIVFGWIKQKIWPIILCMAGFAVVAGINVYNVLFRVVLNSSYYPVSINASSTLTIYAALLVFALSFSNDPNRTYHPKWALPDKHVDFVESEDKA